MNKTYYSPTINVVSVLQQTALLQYSVESNALNGYRGETDEEARVKEQHEESRKDKTWDDSSWDEEW